MSLFSCAVNIKKKQTFLFILIMESILKVGWVHIKIQ